MVFFSAEQLFKNAQNILNAMRANKSEGYELLKEAAQLGHREAMSMLTWGRLLGSRLGPTSSRVFIDDIPNIFEVFKELSETGLPSAHMVRVLEKRLWLVKTFSVKLNLIPFIYYLNI